MKKIKLLLSVIGISFLAGCHTDEKEVIVEVPVEVVVDDPTYSILGQWYAETPMEGEVYDMLDENGEKGPFDHVAVSIHFFTETCASTLFYLFDKELMNYDLYLMGGEKYAIDREGNITFPNNAEFMEKVRKFKYEKGKILVEQTLRDRDVTLTFERMTNVQLSYLAGWQQLISSQHGYHDGDTQQNTDVDDDPATKPSEAARHSWDVED